MSLKKKIQSNHKKKRIPENKDFDDKQTTKAIDANRLIVVLHQQQSLKQDDRNTKLRVMFPLEIQYSFCLKLRTMFSYQRSKNFNVEKSFMVCFQRAKVKI